jgi:diacylglycerol kinase family enzyme
MDGCGFVDGRMFVNLVSGGFGSRVTVETDPKLKERLGGLAYAITGIAHFAELSDNHGRFHAEGFSWEGRFLAMAIGNGRQAGGGIQLCPNALIDDGLLDLTILPAPSCPQWITRRAWMPLGICCAKAREAFGHNWLRREARGSRMNRSATST